MEKQKGKREDRDRERRKTTRGRKGPYQRAGVAVPTQ
jgi:hypothetical protein